ncbi:MAG TPA: histidine kinase dimerization/phospho-acceptor domain-containing protein, partial [Solirubrobacteraceae bacterium]|nr:histidine kinase dimerization/phospho-acceptor domain-containing protein [Solirubrobacteraceae bacterium]
MLAVVALEVPLIISMRDRVDAEVKSQALSQAEIVATSIEDELINRDGLEQVTERAARTLRGRVIVVGRGGRLLADSAGEERIGIDYSTRPEIATALGGEPDQMERRSDTLNQTILATAVPVRRTGGTETIGAVRVTQSVEAVNRATRRATVGLVAIGLLVLLLGLGAGAVIAGQVAGPVRRLDQAARRVAEGDLAARAKVEGSAEQQRLARTFNDMTGRLERLLESHREFVADASHQLRTPLSGLRLRLEEARASTADADAHEEIDAGLRELDRLSAMVSELLVLSQAGEVDAPAEQVDLEDAARRAEARWDGANGGRVISSGAPADGFVPRADLDRALDALIENALHYG